MTKEQMQTTGYHDAFLAVYHLMRRFGEPEDTEAYWNSAATATFDIAEKYKNSEISGFVNGLLSSVWDELKATRDRRKSTETARMEVNDTT